MKQEVGEHHGRWEGKECELNVTITGNSFKAEGSYERTFYPGLLLLAVGSTESLQMKKTKYLVRYEGSMLGKAVKAIYTTTSEEDLARPRTILTGGADPGKPVLMMLSDSLEEIQIYEKSEREDKFYKFTRLS